MDDLNNVFDKIEKAESILQDLEKKRQGEVASGDVAPKQGREHKNTVDHASQRFASIEDKFTKHLAAHARELVKCRENLGLLQTRLKVGEITEEEFQSRSKRLIEKINSLEKKVVESQNVINVKLAEEVSPALKSATPASAPSEETAEKPATQLSADSDIKPPISEIATAENEQEPSAHDVELTDQKTEGSEREQITLKEPPQLDEQPANAYSSIEQANNGASNTQEKETVPEEEDTRISVRPSNNEPVTIKPHKPSFHLHPLNEPPRKKDRTLKSGVFGRNRALWLTFLAIITGLSLIAVVTLVIPRTGSGVGDIAPDFIMQLSNDNVSALSSFHGKNVILVFWDRDFWDDGFFSVNGVIRKLYTPVMLNEFYRKTDRSELEIIAIASGTSNNEIDTLIREYEVKFPVIVDSFGKLRNEYSITEEPTYVFIDKSGKIRSRAGGPLINLSSIEQIVYSISKNTEVKPIKPPITDILIQSVTEKSAVINWSTNIPTTTQVDIDGKVIQTVITPELRSLHLLTLSDLEPDTSYQIRILYNIDNINVSQHSFSALRDTIVSKRFLFVTSEKDMSYPEISNIGTSIISDSAITVSWKTDEPTTGEVDYGTGKEFNDTASQGNKMSIWHTVKIEGLKPDTQYLLRIRASDASGKEAVQEIESVKTLSLIETAPAIGKRAPSFTLTAIDGTEFTLEQFLGKRVLVNFWLEGCAPCELEMPIIQTAFDKYNRDELVILAVNVRGDIDKVKYYVAAQNLSFPVLLDTQGVVDSLYRPPYFPTSYFIDSSGIIRHIADMRFQSISEIDDMLSQIE